MPAKFYTDNEIIKHREKAQKITYPLPSDKLLT